jgi:hypothetical protein
LTPVFSLLYNQKKPQYAKTKELKYDSRICKSIDTGSG